MDLGCEMPAIMKRLFTKEDLRSYLRIFTFVIKLRYLSLIVRKQWKTIAKDLMVSFLNKLLPYNLLIANS